MIDVLSYNPDLEIKGNVLTEELFDSVNGDDNSDTYQYPETIKLYEHFSPSKTVDAIQSLIGDCNIYSKDILKDDYDTFVSATVISITNTVAEIQSDKEIDCISLISYLQNKLKVFLNHFIKTMYGEDIKINDIRSIDSNVIKKVKSLEKSGMSNKINYYMLSSNSNICETIINMITDYRNVLFLIRCKAIEITPEINSKIDNTDIINHYFSKKTVAFSDLLKQFDMTFTNFINIHNHLANKRNEYNYNLKSISELMSVEYYAEELMDMVVENENDYKLVFKDYVKCSLYVLEIINNIYDSISKICDIKYIYNQIS